MNLTWSELSRTAISLLQKGSKNFPEDVFDSYHSISYHLRRSTLLQSSGIISFFHTRNVYLLKMCYEGQQITVEKFGPETIFSQGLTGFKLMVKKIISSSVGIIHRFAIANVWLNEWISYIRDKIWRIMIEVASKFLPSNKTP